MRLGWRKNESLGLLVHCAQSTPVHAVDPTLIKRWRMDLAALDTELWTATKTDIAARRRAASRRSMFALHHSRTSTPAVHGSPISL